MWAGLKHIYGTEGVKGLWRGVDGAIARVMVGSAAQLSTFTTSKQFYVNLEVKYFHCEKYYNCSKIRQAFFILCFTDLWTLFFQI